VRGRDIVSGTKLAVIMDPIESIKPHKDSTLAMLLEAQARGWTIQYGRLEDIWLRDGEAFGRLTDLRVTDDPVQWFDPGDVSVTPLGEMDVILMRKDPPFNVEYVMATYVLERAEHRGAIVVNRPQGLRDANEKAFVSWFPQCAPPTLISRSLDEMRAFITEFTRVVVKPLDVMGGRSVFVTDIADANCNVILETVAQGGTRYTMVQQYLPEVVTSGDKRIFLIDGEPISLALVRIPSQGDHRGNIDVGASTEVRPLTDGDRRICDEIGSVLREKGLLFTGIDVIGDFLTELNVTSPTGVRELEGASDVRITTQLFDTISERVLTR
jgi:glutathione synthase